jgi:5-methylthioadenosine/S-adenosylhomocysteine deaminase
VLDDDKTTQRGSPLRNCGKFIKNWKGKALVRPLVALQGVYVCSAETFAGARELAEREDALLHMHLQETRHEVHEHERKTGKRPVQWLDDAGFLSPRLSAAHCVWFTMNEVRMLKKNGVSVAHCPVSNAKLASGGVAPVPEMQAEGVVVGLGTDSPASNNTLDMFQEMRFCALTHKAHRWDATVLPAQRVLDMATIEGARLLRAERELGSIEIGKAADLAIVDVSSVGMVPTDERTVVSNLVYSCTGAMVRDVLVGGKAVVRGRDLTTAKSRDIASEVTAAARRLRGPGR